MTVLNLPHPSGNIGVYPIFSLHCTASLQKIVLFFALLMPLPASTQFTVATNTLGSPMITSGTSVFGHAVSVCDFDGDGLDDISFGTTDQTPRFYRNIGNGFQLMGLNLTSPNNSIKALLWADIDNDGDRDLFISYENASVRLYENDGAMNLTDITASSGILMETNRRNYGAAFGDYDNDGYLDLYLCKYYNTGEVTGPSYHNILYRNNGNNTFTNVTAAANASLGVNASFMATWFDYNNDGWLDLFVVNDRIYNQNHVLRNNGNGTFTEIAATLNLNAYINAMSCSLGDYNNDLLTDIFVSNSQDVGNFFYEHLANHTFQNVAETAGVQSFELCWSALWMDFDNDGDVDLHVATEQYSVLAPRNLFYVNNGNGTFSENGLNLGLTADNRSTWATAQGDWNMDGYPDYVSHNRAPDHSILWQNMGGSNNYIAVNLVGEVSNRDAIGAKIYCYANNQQQLKTIQCGENYLGQNSHRILFGLGSAVSADSVVVKWPSGHIDRYMNVEANINYTWIEGSGYAGILHCENPSICLGDSTLLIGTGNTITWSNGIADTDSIWVSDAALYWYTATTALGVAFTSEVLEVQVKDLPEVHWIVSSPACASSTGAIGWDGELPSLYTVFVAGDPVILPLTGIYAASYPVAVWSTNGCAAYDTLTVYDPTALTAEVDFDPIPCHGGSTKFNLAISGGTGETSVAWGAVNPSEVFAGTYSFNLSDENGCITPLAVEVLEPEPLALEVTVSNVVLGNDGSAAVSIAGGTPPYSIVWAGNGGFTSSDPTIGNLVDGVYTVQVTDDNGCVVIQSVVILPVGRKENNTVSQPHAFPNPFVNTLHLRNLPSEETLIEVYSLDGRLVLTMSSNAENSVTLNTRYLAPAKYVLVLSSPNFMQRLQVIRLE